MDELLVYMAERSGVIPILETIMSEIVRGDHLANIVLDARNVLIGDLKS